MGDSQDPLYKKGYQRGRQKTEHELKLYFADRGRREIWNEIYTSLLPTALVCQNWTMGDKKVTSTDDRVELAKRWADAAMRNIK